MTTKLQKLEDHSNRYITFNRDYKEMEFIKKKLSFFKTALNLQLFLNKVIFR